MKNKYRLLILIFFSSTQVVIAQPGTKTPPALASIKTEDLKTDLYALAADHFRGREAGTPDEIKTAAWWAEKVRAEGLEPAGDDGTYFQFYSMQRNRVSASSRISIGDHSLQLWKDVLVAQTAPADIDAPIIFMDKPTKAEIDQADLKGKAVVITASPEGINLNISLPERRYPGFVFRKYNNDLTAKGVAAIIFVADEMGEKSWPAVIPAMSRGTFDIEGGPNATVSAKPPVLWVHAGAMDWIKNGNLNLHASIQVEHFEYPSVNVVAKIKGTDPQLKNEYVLFSAHHDHDGIRLPYGKDSIYNGADDNGSTTVALLAIARAFKKNPGRRSILFVWHGAEERGLLGSKWYSAHTTVPRSSSVAVMNGDMIGRNNIDSAALLGVKPPHRNSPDLVTMAMDANMEGPKFKLDTLWDKPEHVEFYYFRSDHLPYARLGIPVVYFTSLLHPDYHTPMDEPERINYEKLKKMTEWMYRTGWKVANADMRPATDPNFKLER